MVAGGECMVSQRGACMVKGGHVWYAHTPPLRDTAGQCAGGTHPTGMHSCFHIILTKIMPNKNAFQ